VERDVIFGLSRMFDSFGVEGGAEMEVFREWPPV